MQIVIEIPESVYEHLKQTTEDSHDEDIAIDAIIHGVKIGQAVYEPFVNGIHEGTDPASEPPGCPDPTLRRGARSFTSFRMTVRRPRLFSIRRHAGRPYVLKTQN